MQSHTANYWSGKPELKTKQNSVLAPALNAVERELTVTEHRQNARHCAVCHRLWAGHHYFHFTDENIKPPRSVLCLDCTSLFPPTHSCLDNKNSSFRPQLRSHFLQEAFFPWTPHIQWVSLLCCPTALSASVPVVTFMCCHWLGQGLSPSLNFGFLKGRGQGRILLK